MEHDDFGSPEIPSILRRRESNISGARSTTTLEEGIDHFVKVAPLICRQLCQSVLLRVSVARAYPAEVSAELFVRLFDICREV